MKKELLRIFNLNCQYTDVKSLTDVSLLVVEGDRIGFFGLSQSGKDFLIRLLSGKEETDIPGMNIYLRGKKAADITELRSFFYHMVSTQYRFSWTVAEYIFLQESGWLMLRKQTEKLFDLAGACLEELNIDIDVSKKISELTELEKRIVEIVKACHLGASIIIIEDEFEGMQQEDLLRFSRILDRIQTETGIAVIVNSNSEQVMGILARRYVIFKNGRIVKKGYNKNQMEPRQVEAFLLGKTMGSRKKSLEAYSRELQTSAEKSDEIVYSIRRYDPKEKKNLRFDFCKGRITTLLMNRNEEKEKLFEILSGYQTEEDIRRAIDGKILTEKGISHMMEHKIVGIRHLGSREEVFPNMTISDNLILPSLRKVTALQYIRHSTGFRKSILAKKSELFTSPYEKISALETDERIAATLERWYIYNPHVLVLLEPFIYCDVYGVSIVKNYLRKFASRSTAVVILKSREEYVEDFSDEMILLE